MTEDPVSLRAREMMALWIAAIADNVGNPVAGMRAAVAILGKELDRFKTTGTIDEGLVETTLRMITGRLESLAFYITELRDFARPARLTIKPLAPRDVLEDAVSELPQGASVSIRLDPALAQRPVLADESRLGATLKALTRNAYEAVPSDRRPEIIVEARLVKEAFGGGLDGCAFLVADNGPGVSPEIRKVMFEPFYSTKEAGTGLGMALVKKYTDAHGGRIQCGTSELGGFEIAIILPLHGEAGSKE